MNGRSEGGDEDAEGEREVGVCVCRAPAATGCSPQDAVTLKGVNADWAKAHQSAHARTHSLQRAQTGFYC